MVAVGPTAEVGAGRRTIDAEGALRHARASWTSTPTSTPSWPGTRWGRRRAGTASRRWCWATAGSPSRPCKPGDREELAEMMESVEDIPADSIMDGPGLGLVELRRVPRRGRALAQGPQRGRHGRPLRGAGPRHGRAQPERGAGRPPTTSSACAPWWTRPSAPAPSASPRHGRCCTGCPTVDRCPARGPPTTSCWPSPRSWAAISGACSRPPRGWASATTTTTPPSRAEIDLLADITEASGRPVTFGLAHSYRRDDLYRRVLEMVNEQQRGRGQRAAPDHGPGHRHPVRPVPPHPLRPHPALEAAAPALAGGEADRAARPGQPHAAHRGRPRRRPDEFFTGAYVLDDDHLDYAHDPANTLKAGGRPPRRDARSRRSSTSPSSPTAGCSSTGRSSTSGSTR